ncbi:hypothetical protein QL285_070243 [Trifolium repens]|nr:hypothetical protein QL285_070243 [Trifolium repens]
MSRGIDFIKDINDYKETWRLQVSIVDVWSVVNLSKGTKHIEIVVMDLKLQDWQTYVIEAKIIPGKNI